MEVKSNQQIPVTDSDVTLVTSPLTTLKVPVVIAETTIQIVVEADISLILQQRKLNE